MKDNWPPKTTGGLPKTLRSEVPRLDEVPIPYGSSGTVGTVGLWLGSQDLGPNGAPCWLMMIGSSTTQYIYIHMCIYMYIILYWRWDYHNNGNSRFRRSFVYSTFLRGIWEFPGFWDVFGFRGHSTCLTPCRWIRYPLCISWRFPLQAAPVPILISQECTQGHGICDHCISTTRDV